MVAMKVGDLVVIIPDNCKEFRFHLSDTVGIITERDDDYEAKGITGNLVNLVKVQFGDHTLWFDTDQVGVL